jgi:hypothetical protein
MIEEELKQDAEKSLNKRLGTYAYIRKQDCYTNYVDGYIAGAESREKQILIDAEQIRALQKQNGELTDKVKELEAQIEKMKQCGNCGNGTIGNCEYCKRKPKQKSTDTNDYWKLREIKEK